MARGVRQPVSHSRDAGFSLVETLVTLALTAAAVVYLTSAGIASWRSLRVAEANRHALELAQSILATVGTERPLEPGRTLGADGASWRWELEIAPYAPPQAMPERVRVAGFRVTVTVRGPDASEARLVTLKLSGSERQP